MSTPALPRRPGVQVSLGPIVFGVLLVLFGAAWLLDSTGVWSVSWGMALPLTLIAIGLVLAAVAFTGPARHGGLVALGVVLSVILAFSTMVDVPLQGRIGDFVERPATVQQVQTSYQQAIGSQTVDLRDVAFPTGTTVVKASLAIGDLLVRVPPDVGLSVHFTVGAGDATVLGRNYSGASLDNTFTTENFATATSKVQLELSMGLGSIEVQQ